MKYTLPLFILASHPAYAHSLALPHTHQISYLPILSAFALVIITGMLAYLKAAVSK
jgi:hypothetical protein